MAGAAFGSETWAFGLGIFDMFCRYMLSSGGLVGRFCPLVQLASGTHMAAAFPGSDLGASELVVSSHLPKYLHKPALWHSGIADGLQA